MLVKGVSEVILKEMHVSEFEWVLTIQLQNYQMNVHRKDKTTVS